MDYAWYRPVANAEVGDLVVHNPYLRPWHSVDYSILNAIYIHTYNELIHNTTLSKKHKNMLVKALKEKEISDKKQHTLYGGMHVQAGKVKYLLSRQHTDHQKSNPFTDNIYKITSIRKGSKDQYDWRADIELVHGHNDHTAVYESVRTDNGKESREEVQVKLPTIIKNIELSALRPLQLLNPQDKAEAMADIHGNKFNLTLSNNSYHRHNRDYPQMRNEVTYVTFKNTDYKEIYKATQYDYKKGGIKGKKVLVLNDQDEYEPKASNKTTLIPFSEVELVRARGRDHQDPTTINDHTVANMYPDSLPKEVGERIEKVERVDIGNIISNATI